MQPERNSASADRIDSRVSAEHALENASEVAFAAFSRWRQSPLASDLLEAERAELSVILDKLFGYHLLILGANGAEELTSISPVAHHIRVSGIAPALGDSESTLISPLNALPLQNDSVDVVLLNHCLEFSHDPRGVLREAVRVLRPGGHILLLGFQPASLWGLKSVLLRICYRCKLLTVHGPWGGRFLGSRRLLDWLALLEIQSRPTRYFKHGFALEHPWLRAKLTRGNGALERWLRSRVDGRGLPGGSVALLWGVKESRPLTPSASSWRRSLKSTLPVSAAPLRESPSQSKM